MMRCCTCKHIDCPPDQPPCVDGCQEDNCEYWEEADESETEAKNNG